MKTETRTEPQHLRPPLEQATQTPVSEIMTREVITVRSELSVESLMQLLLDHDLSRVPVVDEEGRPIGMVSKTDLLLDRHDAGDTAQEGLPPLPAAGGVRYREAGFHVHEEPTRTVGEVMSPTVLSLKENATVANAAEVMAVHHVHGLPIVSKGGKLLGMLSSIDILAWLAGIA